MSLTAQAINVHDRMSKRARGTVGDALSGRGAGVGRRSRSDSSSACSIVSSELSDLDEEMETTTSKRSKGAKRRRVSDGSTPPTSVGDDATSEGGCALAKKAASNKKVKMPGSYNPKGKAMDRSKMPFPEEDVVDRKEYLQVGLYAAVQPTQPSSSRLQKRQQQDKRKKAAASCSTTKQGKLSAKTIETISNSFTWGLPLHYGATLLEQKRIFRLPWDILNDFDLSRLPATPEGIAFRSDALDRIGKQKVPTVYKNIAQSE